MRVPLSCSASSIVSREESIEERSLEFPSSTRDLICAPVSRTARSTREMAAEFMRTAGAMVESSEVRVERAAVVDVVFERRLKAAEERTDHWEKAAEEGTGNVSGGAQSVTSRWFPYSWALYI